MPAHASLLGDSGYFDSSLLEVRNGLRSQWGSLLPDAVSREVIDVIDMCVSASVASFSSGTAKIKIASLEARNDGDCLLE